VLFFSRGMFDVMAGFISTRSGSPVTETKILELINSIFFLSSAFRAKEISEFFGRYPFRIPFLDQPLVVFLIRIHFVLNATLFTITSLHKSEN
jgi:hypothetical protein